MIDLVLVLLQAKSDAIAESGTCFSITETGGLL